MPSNAHPDNPLRAFALKARAVVDDELSGVAPAWRRGAPLRHPDRFTVRGRRDFDDVIGAHKSRGKLLKELHESRPAAQAALEALGNGGILSDAICDELLALCADLQTWDAQLREQVDVAETAGAAPERLAALRAHYLERAEGVLEEVKLPRLLTRLSLLERQANRLTAAVANPLSGPGEASVVRLDLDTRTVTLKNQRYPIDNAKTFALYEAIVDRRPAPITRAELQTKVKGCQGPKTIRALLDQLPEPVRKTVESGPNGYSFNASGHGKRAQRKAAGSEKPHQKRHT